MVERTESQDPNPTSKRVTLTDVALASGVSVQTASHVMSGNLKVRLPETTRDRVKEAAKKLGYQPNRLAQAMKTGKTNMVSLWMPIDRPNYFFMRTLTELSKAVKDDHYDLMVVGLESAQAYGEETRLPYQWPVDGVMSIDAGRAMNTWRTTPGNERIPLSILGNESFDFADTVSWNVIEGSRSVIRRFIANDCRKIVHVSPSWVLERFPKEQRRRGYFEAMDEAGLEPVFIGTAEESASSAAAAISAYIQSHGVPDAFSCFTDTFAIGAMRALLEKGVSVPNDCQVIGFGNFPEAEDHRIPISTVVAPITQIVPQAWTWLNERIQAPNLESRSMMFEMDIILRATTRV
jgi:DNA-binding LacI/PurR family transcriptional regulator